MDTYCACLKCLFYTYGAKTGFARLCMHISHQPRPVKAISIATSTKNGRVGLILTDYIVGQKKWLSPVLLFECNVSSTYVWPPCAFWIARQYFNDHLIWLVKYFMCLQHASTLILAPFGRFSRIVSTGLYCPSAPLLPYRSSLFPHPVFYAWYTNVMRF